MKVFITGSTCIALLTVLQHSAGFGLPDFLHSLDKSKVARDTNADNEATKVIIDAVLRVADVNGDGEVTVEEARTTTNRIFRSFLHPRSESGIERYSEAIGGIMTAVIVADADDSQSLERTEIEKVAQTLIKEGGRAITGRVIEAEMNVLRVTGIFTDTPTDTLVAMMLQVGDSNGDDILSLEEAETVFNTSRFAWQWNGDNRIKFLEADQNSDNQLNRQEIADWTTALEEGEGEGYFIWMVFVYRRIIQLAGREIAEMNLREY